MNLRGTTHGLALALAMLVSACGGSDIVGSLKPARIVSFGDGYTELRSGAEWTVKNTAQPNIWVRQLASRYGLGGGSLTAAVEGGHGYGQGGAAITCRDDAVHPCAGAPSTLDEQIQFARSNGDLGMDSLVAVMIGASDGIHYAGLARDGVIDDDTLRTRMHLAAAALHAQASTLVDDGLKVIVLTLPKLGNSPLGLTDETLKSKLQLATAAFNGELLRLLGSESNRIDGRDLALIDAERVFDLYVGDDVENRRSFEFTREPACGAGVTALACTSVVEGASADFWVFAAEVYPTPGFHRELGNQVYNVTRSRF